MNHDGYFPQTMDLLGALDEPSTTSTKSAKEESALSVIPNEVLVEVFTHCLPPYPACPPLYGAYSPTQLTHVCRLWRDLATATPALWRAISLDLIPNGSPVDEPLAEKLLGTAETWLRRSGTLSLSVVLRCRWDQHPEPLAVASLALSAFLAHHERWEYAELRVPPSPDVSQDPAENADIHRAMPRLVCLRLTASYLGSEAVLGHIHAPKLRTLYARASNDAFYFWLFDPPTWQRLTCLKLKDLPPDYAAQILAQATGLVHCWLRIWDSEAAPVSERIHLPHLQTFVITAHQRRTMTELLDALVLPSIKRLAIREAFLGALAAAGPQKNAFVPALAHLFSRWGSSLARLAVLDCELIEVAAAGAKEPFLQAFPSLVDVELFLEDEERSVLPFVAVGDAWDDNWPLPSHD
ncbi:F-box domain-containing protein [Mycena indigotica]|uniref:F-box domain-containing protein n=1 Tax=Mycena indigotica TaxID=2126181 RepID=A0A8H6T3C5_9AGAR|nr:F-box domain-containing protein [Mycena indigotica]KAF7310110.1 F-box domain-containing protein [Mycena indigotica]